MKLYELAQDYMELVELEGQVDEEHLELIKQAVMEEIENKSGNIIKIIKSIESDVKSIDEEIKRLNALKKAKNNTINSIKEYTKQHLININAKKIQTPFGNITVRNNAPSLNIIDENLIPNEFKELKVEYTINKNDIKDLLKDGKKIAGCELKFGKSLIIK